MTTRNLLLWMLIVTLGLANCTMLQPPNSEPSPTSRVLPFQPFDQFRPFGPYRPVKAPVPWVTNEIVFFGATKDIQELLSALPENLRALEPEFVDRFDLTALVGGSIQNDASIKFFDEFFGGRPSGQQLEQRIGAELYRFKKNIDILQFIEAVNGVRNQRRDKKERALFAFAEPNFWLTSLQATQTCKSVSGQPNSFGNGPFGTGVNSTGELAEFNSQWAFQLLAGASMTSPQPDPIESDTIAESSDVNVVIFDNSPFTDVPETATGTGTPQMREVELTSAQAMTLQVLHWTLGNQFAPSIASSDEHGVFIASLIHKIVPNSTISLVRVLDGAGCGVSYALNNALAEFAQKYKTGKQSVFNLSLGIPETKIEIPPKMYLEAVLTNYLASKDIMVVAAAGNNQIPSLLLPAGYVDDPAYSPYVEVVAVEASNITSTRACFSNWGKDLNADGISDRAILAPGGDGTGPGCSSSLAACENKTTCPNGIMGRTHDKHWVFWSGTSFATPLVSGAAARWLTQGCSASKVVNHLTTSPQLKLTGLSCP